MRPSFRIVHFVPDPVAGGRVPVAAVVAFGTTTVLVQAKHLPGPECVGGVRSYASMQLLVDALQRRSSMEMLPAGAGPHALLDDIRPLPAEVADLEAASMWLQAAVLPRDPGEEGPGLATRPQRSTVGREFVRNHWGVTFRTRFRPHEHLRGWDRRHAGKLDPVSNWVYGKEHLLLLEPLVPLSPHFDVDARAIGTNFGAYRFAIHHAKAEAVQVPQELHFITYILPGARSQQIDEAIESCAYSSSFVANLSSKAEHNRLRSLVHEVAADDPQSELQFWRK